MSNVNNLDDVGYVKKDRMRYEKNKISANLAILAIVFNGLFFISIYKSNVGDYYYNILMGISIVYNLLFMLIVFLVSEGSKNYRMRYSVIALVVGILQFCRLFAYPRIAHSATYVLPDQSVATVMQTSQFIRVIIYLCVSGICLILSSIIGIKKCRDLKSHLAQLNQEGE